MKKKKTNNRFTGLIGIKYNKLLEALPHLINVEEEIAIAALQQKRGNLTRPISILDLGCGTGMTTFALCEKINNATIVGVDNTPAMLRQYKHLIRNQKSILQRKRIKITTRGDNALHYLKFCDSESFDIVVSGFVLHNLPKDVRHNIIMEIGRVLVPQGRFVNGDKITDNNEIVHQKNLMDRFAAYVSAYNNDKDHAFGLGWIKHDIFDDHVDQRLTEYEICSCLTIAGFKNIHVSQRLGLDAIVVADR